MLTFARNAQMFFVILFGCFAYRGPQVMPAKFPKDRWKGLWHSPRIFQTHWSSGATSTNIIRVIIPNFKQTVSRWWFQPCWKICSSNWLPKVWGENNKYLKPPTVVYPPQILSNHSSFSWFHHSHGPPCCANQLLDPHRLLPRAGRSRLVVWCRFCRSHVGHSKVHKTTSWSRSILGQILIP